MLENSSTEKVTTRCLYCITSLVLYKQKLSMVFQKALDLLWYIYEVGLEAGLILVTPFCV